MLKLLTMNSLEELIYKIIMDNLHEYKIGKFKVKKVNRKTIFKILAKMLDIKFDDIYYKMHMKSSIFSKVMVRICKELNKQYIISIHAHRGKQHTKYIFCNENEKNEIEKIFKTRKTKRITVIKCNGNDKI